MALPNSQELETEMRALVISQLPEADSGTAAYLANLFAAAKMPRWEEIRLDWAGSRKEIPAEGDRNRIIKEKLGHSRRVGDSCLTL